MPRKIPTALAEALIAAIQKRECLYDPTNPGYKNRNTSELAWKDVADEVERDVKSAKSLWASLRATFNRNLANTKQPNGFGATREPKWAFFTQMLFLKRHVSHGQMISNIVTETDEFHAEPKVDPQAQPKAEPQTESQAEPQAEPQAVPSTEACASSLGSEEVPDFVPLDTQISLYSNSEESSLASEDSNVVMDTSVIGASTKGKGKKRKAKSDPVQYAVLKFIKNKQQSQQQEEKNLGFFKALLPYFNTLSPVQQLDYMQQITRILLEMVSAGNNAE